MIVSRHVVTHDVRVVQDGLSASAWVMLKGYGRLAKAPDRFNDRVARCGVARLMQETGFSRSTVIRCKKELRAKLAIEVIEREDPFSSMPQLVKIYSFKRILATWRQKGLTHVIRNRGKQFVTEVGDLIEMTLPALPEFVKRAVDAAMAMVHRIAGPRRKPYAAPALNADAVAEAATMADEQATGIWKAIQEELRPKMLRQRFDTWIEPLRGWDLRDRVLHVKLPSPQFSHVGGKYASEFREAIEKLKLDVKLEFFHGPPT